MDLDHDSVMPLNELVCRLQSGRHIEEYFRILYRRYYRALCRFFLHQGCKREHCEDLAQETLFAVYRGLASFRHEASFESWLFGIARNIFIQSLRRSRLNGKKYEFISLEDILDSQPENMKSGEGNPAFDQVLRAELCVALDRRISSFPAQMRRCAELRFRQGLSYREIAKVVSISLDAVKMQLARARKQLHCEISRLNQPR